MELEIKQSTTYQDELDAMIGFISRQINDERCSPLDFYGQVIYNIGEHVINIQLEELFAHLRTPLTGRQHEKVSALGALKTLAANAAEYGHWEGLHQASRWTEEVRQAFLHEK